MKKYFTLVVFLLFVSATLSAEYDKPCKNKYCTEYEWYNNGGRFDPHTIHWPLHYTGEVYQDYHDGGHYNIEIEHGHYGKSHRDKLHYFRSLPECPDPHYLRQGIKMPDPFECEAHVYDEPKWKDSNCSELAAGYEDQNVYVDGPACSKILRHWTIIDWCKWKPNTRSNTYNEKYVLVHDRYKDKSYFAYGHGHHDVEHDGYYTYTQVIKIVDYTAPELVSCEEVSVNLPSGKCEAHVKLKNTIVDAGPCPGEKIAVELVVKDYDEKVVASKWLNAKHDKEFWIDLDYLDAGHYTIHWKYKDGCGNSNHCVQYLKVEDKNPPHLLCIKDLSTSISDDYGVSIWAKDFVHKLSGKCMTDDIKISFNPNDLEMSRHFDCDGDLGIQQMTVYATDSKGNQASCYVELFISDHNDCIDGQQVAGIVMDRDRYPLGGVDVNVYQGEEMLSTSQSDDNGHYNMQGVPSTKSLYTIQPNMVDDSKDGLDNADLIMLLRHLTDVQDFDEVLEYGAADINSDGAITLDDYWDLTAIIYDLPGRGVENISRWKFFDAKKFNGYRGRASKLIVPIPIKEFKTRYDIMGIKVGDINFSLGRKKSAKTRSGNLIRTEYTSAKVQGMQRYDIALGAELTSYGMVLNFENATTEDIQGAYAGGRKLEYIARQDGNNLEVTIASTDELNGAELSVYISSNARLSTQGSMINHNGETLYMDDLQLSESVTTDVVMQAYPNPFDNILEVSYLSAKNVSGDLEIIGLDGKSIINTPVQLIEGVNRLQVNTEGLSSGIFLLRISHEGSSEVMRITKAMP